MRGGLYTRSLIGKLKKNFNQILYWLYDLIVFKQYPNSTEGVVLFIITGDVH